MLCLIQNVIAGNLTFIDRAVSLATRMNNPPDLASAQPKQEVVATQDPYGGSPLCDTMIKVLIAFVK